MTDQEISQQVGKLQGEMSAVQANQLALWQAVDEIRSDQKTILATLNQARGSWKILVGVASLAAGAGAGFFKLVSVLTGGLVQPPYHP